MAAVVADRVMESSATTGTGAFALDGAYTGYRAFADVCSVNDTVPYVIIAIDANGNPSGDWEAGIGAYSGADTLTRSTVQASTNGGAAVAFAAGVKRVLLSPTADYVRRLYRVGFFFATTPTASEVLLLHTASDAFLLSDDFVGAVGDVGTNPTSSFALDVQKNGASVGTITIATNGAFTFATTGTTVSMAAGDQLKVVGPATPDATCANVSITFKGFQQ